MSRHRWYGWVDIISRQRRLLLQAFRALRHLGRHHRVAGRLSRPRPSSPPASPSPLYRTRSHRHRSHVPPDRTAAAYFVAIICRSTCGLGYRRTNSACSIFIAGNIASRASSAESSMLEGFNCCSNHRFTPIACTAATSPGRGPKVNRFSACSTRSCPCISFTGTPAGLLTAQPPPAAAPPSKRTTHQPPMLAGNSSGLQQTLV